MARALEKGIPKGIHHDFPPTNDASGTGVGGVENGKGWKRVSSGHDLDLEADCMDEDDDPDI